MDVVELDNLRLINYKNRKLDGLGLLTSGEIESLNKTKPKNGDKPWSKDKPVITENKSTKKKFLKQVLSSSVGGLWMRHFVYLYKKDNLLRGFYKTSNKYRPLTSCNLILS